MSKFMSGMISGFMAGFGGAMGGMMGAGGADAAAGADAGAAADATGATTSTGVSTASDTASTGGGGGSPLSGIMGGGGSASTAAMPTGQQMASTVGGGDITRTFPGDTSPADTQAKVAAANQPAQDNAGQQFGKQLQKMGQQMQSDAQKRQAANTGNAYQAMFAAPSNPTPALPARAAIQQAPITSLSGGMQTPDLNPPPAMPIAPPPQGQPLQMQMQMPQTQPVPQIPLGAAVSDKRAKMKVLQGNKELDDFLNRVYTNVVANKGKK